MGFISNCKIFLPGLSIFVQHYHKFIQNKETNYVQIKDILEKIEIYCEINEDGQRVM